MPEARHIKLKVLIYATWGDRLLTFTEPEFPDLLPQVPGGTVEPGEEFEAAALREFEEETGIAVSARPKVLGHFDFHGELVTRNTFHRRHFFHLPLEMPLPEHWEHFEQTPSDGGKPILFAFSWIAIKDVGERLGYEHGAALPLLAQFR